MRGNDHRAVILSGQLWSSTLSSVVYFSRGTLPKKGFKGTTKRPSAVPSNMSQFARLTTLNGAMAWHLHLRGTSCPSIGQLGPHLVS